MVPNMPTGKGDPTAPVKLDPSSFDPRNPGVTPQNPDLAATFSGAVKRLARGKVVTNAADAYWYSQPAPVQELYYLHTENERDSLAHLLADAGYKIDVPIMVWGWDPLATMVLRQNGGYTWVPSAKMPNVQVAPGLNFPGLPSYDPNTIPDGAIIVSTDWAKGYEKTDVWLYDSNGNRKF